MQAKKLHSVALNLEPSQFLSGWRQEAGTLFLPTLSEARVGEAVAVRIGIFGQTIRATVLGSVALVRRVGRPSLPPGVELHLDKGSLAAASFLAAASRGEKVSFRERSPRFLLAMPLRIFREGVEIASHTVNVSEGGCAVLWAGPLPMVGEVIDLKLADGFLAPKIGAVVCWNSLGGGEAKRAAGLRVVATGRAGRAWARAATNAARSGAPPS